MEQKNENRHSRRLHNRQARFMGSYLPSDNVLVKDSPTSIKSEPGQETTDGDDDLYYDTSSCSHLPKLLKMPKRRNSANTDVLREISDTNIPQYQRRSTCVSSHCNSEQCSEELNTNPFQDQSLAQGHDASRSNSSKPLRRLHPRIRSRAGTSHRTSSGENNRYIEHLESQIAALQTQVQSLLSPSSEKSHPTKLRSLNSENKILQEELNSWEKRFAERLQEQVDHYERVTGHMRGRILDLESEVTERDGRLVTLEKSLQDRSKQLDGAQYVNHDLERRLEYLSGLVETSPIKINLEGPPALEIRTHDVDVISRRSNVTPLSPNRPETSFRTFKDLPRNDIGTGSSMAADMSRGSSFNGSYSACDFDPARDSGYATDKTADFVDSTTLFYTSSKIERPSSRRVSLSQIRSEDRDPGLSKTGKPVRRMRRFYAGSTRQSLILPYTSSGAGSKPLSATDEYCTGPGLFASTCTTPSSPSPNVAISVHRLQASLFTSSDDVARHSSKPMSGVRRKSLTWGEEDSGADDQSWDSSRKSSNQSSLSSVHVGPNLIDHAETCPRNCSERSSSDLNLFEELSKIKQGRYYARNISCSNSSRPKQRDISHSQSLHLTPSCDLDTAVGETSLNTEPNEEVRVDTDYQRVPSHSRNLATSSGLQQRSNSVQASVHSLFSILLRPLAQYLNPLRKSAESLLHRTWENLSLSKPALEFRVWLVRLLLSRLGHKHGVLLVLRRPYTPSSSISSAVTFPLVGTAPVLGFGVAGCPSRWGAVDISSKFIDPADPSIDITPRAGRSSLGVVHKAASSPQAHRFTLSDTGQLGSNPGIENLHDSLNNRENGEVVIAEISSGCGPRGSPVPAPRQPPSGLPHAEILEDDVRLQDEGCM